MNAEHDIEDLGGGLAPERVEDVADVIWDLTFAIKAALSHPGEPQTYSVPTRFNATIGYVMNAMQAEGLEFGVDAGTATITVSIVWHGKPLPGRREPQEWRERV